jgi:hypothetical protein
MSIDHLARSHPVSVIATLLAGNPSVAAEVDAEPEPEPEDQPAHRRLVSLLAWRWRPHQPVTRQTGAPTGR